MLTDAHISSLGYLWFTQKKSVIFMFSSINQAKTHKYEFNNVHFI